MEIEFARTFLAVAETGSFLKAAERVHVTQSTVSSRIKVLEDSLRQPLFQRKKTGVALTPAGKQFIRHAQSLVRTWEQARLEVGLPSGLESRFVVGGQYSLWDGYLLNWLPWLRQQMPEAAINAQIGGSAVLAQRLSEGLLDLAVMYQPPERPGFELKHLFDEQLIMVSSDLEHGGQMDENYIFVNWGDEFQSDHRQHFPDFATPRMLFDLGTLGVNYLLDNRATGYFPRRIVTPYLDSGELVAVAGMPTLTYPTFAVMPSGGDGQVTRLALQGLRLLAGQTGGSSA